MECLSRLRYVREGRRLFWPMVPALSPPRVRVDQKTAALVNDTDLSLPQRWNRRRYRYRIRLPVIVERNDDRLLLAE